MAASNETDSTGSKDIHVQSLESEHDLVQREFILMVSGLLTDAPNSAPIPSLTTKKRMIFSTQRNHEITVSSYVGIGNPGTYEIEIGIPVVIDKVLPKYQHDDRPLNPYETVKFISSLHANTLNIYPEVSLSKGSNRLIPVAEYTAGGLTPHIETVGAGKLEAFKRVIFLFKGYRPQHPEYERPFRESMEMADSLSEE